MDGKELISLNLGAESTPETLITPLNTISFDNEVSPRFFLGVKLKPGEVPPTVTIILAGSPVTVCVQVIVFPLLSTPSKFIPDDIDLFKASKFKT